MLVICACVWSVELTVCCAIYGRSVLYGIQATVADKWQFVQMWRLAVQEQIMLQGKQHNSA